MLETVVKYFAIGGPIVLALMGAAVVDRQPRTGLGRAIWYLAFAAVGLASVFAAVGQDTRLTTMLTGGDNFPELFGLLKPDQNGRLRLQLTNGKGTPLFDVSFSIMKAGTFTPIASRNWGTLLNGAFDTGILIEPGAYQIDIVARNGWFIEMYFLGTCKGQIFQDFRITMPLANGKLVRQSPPKPDPDCLKALGAPPTGDQ